MHMPFVLANSLTTPIQNFVGDLVEPGVAFSKIAVFSSSERQENRRELSLSMTHKLTQKRPRLHDWMEETDKKTEGTNKKHYRKTP